MRRLLDLLLPVENLISGLALKSKRIWDNDHLPDFNSIIYESELIAHKSYNRAADKDTFKSGGMIVCEVQEDVIKKLKAFKFRKAQNNAALILKVDAQNMVIVEDESFEDVSIEELQDSLPTHEPRYVLLSYVFKHKDGRTSYPYCMIFVSPSGCKPEMQMMYAGSMNNLVQLAQVTKVFEVRSTDELDEDWLIEKLSFFR